MNIYDIAEKSGVSIATVSRVLNNNPHVRAQTRERVMAVIEQEGFTPNAFARGLGLGSMRMVGILCTDIRDAHYAEMVGSIEAHLRKNTFNAVLRCADATAEDTRQALDYLLQQNVDAIVHIGCTVKGDGNASPLAIAAKQVPIILINDHIASRGVHCVTCDEQGAMCDIMKALFQRHKKRVLFLHNKMTYSCQQKILGYREACAQYGETPNEALFVEVDSRLDAVNDCIKKLLVHGVTFDAVIGAEDILAIGAQKSLLRIGLTMPIIGFNNSILARCATPELTSVDTGFATMCDTAMQMLDKLLDKKRTPSHTVIPTKLVERDSFRLN